jgi:single-strand DNA-binding protein
MSRGLNKIQIIGRLGRDPEMRYTSDGKPVTNFSVATGGSWTDRDGNQRDDTEWFRVEAWERLAETCNQYLTKGSQVYIEGRIKSRKYTDKDGVERTSVDVVASTMLILGSRNSNGAGEGDYQEEDAPPASAPAPRASAPAPASRAPAPQAPARTAAPAPAAPQRASAPPQRSAPPARPASRNQPQPIESEDDIPF